MLINGDSLTELKRFEDNSIDSMVTDPPAGIAFMGKHWDTKDQFQVQMRAIFDECLRVLKPGAHGFVWALPRISHHTATALEEAGFEIRDVVTHVFGSGFPKSHNVGNGWGTALKPASEHWILVRKPLEKGLSVAKNVLEHGTGAINIDASRIGCNDKSPFPVGDYGDTDFRPALRNADTSPNGRFPANFMLSHHEECEEVGTREDSRNFTEGFMEHSNPREVFGATKQTNAKPRSIQVPVFKCHQDCPVAELDRQSGNVKSVGGVYKNPGQMSDSIFGMASPARTDRYAGESGGASRFFYCAKPSKSERNAGLDDFPERTNQEKEGRCGQINSKSNLDGSPRTPVTHHNTHPTVKPTKLMRYLITMICPAGGQVLDPFAGSATTGVAAIETKREFLGIEREEEYHEQGEARLAEARGDNDEYNRLFN